MYLSRPTTIRGGYLSGAAVLLAVALFLLAMLLAEPEDGLLFLLVVPITMIAAEYGVFAACLMAAASAAILILVDSTRDSYSLSALGYSSRVALYFLTAVIVGKIFERLRTDNETLIDSVLSEQARNSALLNTVSALVAILDSEGRITYFNPASERISGYRSNEVVGKRLVDILIPASDVEAITEALRNIRPDDLPVAGESAWLTKEGQLKMIRWNATALTGPDGEIEHLIATGLDVTERHEAELAVVESQERLATYFDNAPSLLFWMNLEGRFIEVNKSSEQLLNQPREKLVGSFAWDFFTPEIGRSIKKTNKQVLDGGQTIQAEDSIETPDGIQHFQTIKFPLRRRDGEIYGIGGISYNITALVDARRAVEQARFETVARLARAVEFRDEETVDHVERMSSYCELIARRLGFEEQRCRDIRTASAMHDAGKIAVPDSILLKPGPLTAEERKIMESHAEVGWHLLRGSEWEVLELAALIAHTHHERFDGTGYPRGLAGFEIPIEGRIAAVADVFDALTTDRVYRKALPPEEALELMRSERGAHFDPVVFDAFLAGWQEIHAEATAATAIPSNGETMLPLSRSVRD